MSEISTEIFSTLHWESGTVIVSGQADGGQHVLDSLISDRSPNTPEPAPKKTNGPAIWDLVRIDIDERDRDGARKYGQRLKAGDGRDALIDAYQEALDLVVYLRKAIEER